MVHFLLKQDRFVSANLNSENNTILFHMQVF